MTVRAPIHTKSFLTACCKEICSKQNGTSEVRHANRVLNNQLKSGAVVEEVHISHIFNALESGKATDSDIFEVQLDAFSTLTGYADYKTAKRYLKRFTQLVQNPEARAKVLTCG